MSPLIEEHYFGGREVFYNDLLNRGLLNPICQRCRKGLVTLFFDNQQTFPRSYCPECKDEVASCRHGTIFDIHGIRRIPAFMFLVKCVIPRVPNEAAITLSGLDPDIARDYIKVIRVVMTHTADLFTKTGSKRWEIPAALLKWVKHSSPSASTMSGGSWPRMMSSFLG